MPVTRIDSTSWHHDHWTRKNCTCFAGVRAYQRYMNQRDDLWYGHATLRIREWHREHCPIRGLKEFKDGVYLSTKRLNASLHLAFPLSSFTRKTDGLPNRGPRLDQSENPNIFAMSFFPESFLFAYPSSRCTILYYC